jgi:S-(hydroxymethyl)glutathione dehydrogenase/alcohol dehydrogenase
LKAAVLRRLNAPLDVLDIEPVFHKHDTVCATGQVLVDVICSGICGAQLQEIQGNKGNAGLLPHLVGHEACVRIRDVGAGVNRQMVGRKAVAHWRKGAGPEAFQTARYEHGDLAIGAGHITTLSEQSIVSANRLTVVDEDVPDDICALLGCGLSTALGTIEQEAKVKFGESVLIVGCGGLGLNLIVAAKLANAYPIVGADVHDKYDVVMKMGATNFWPWMHSELIMRCKKFDVIIDTTGSAEAFEKAVPFLADSGRYVLIGQPKPGEHLKIMGAASMFAGEGKHIMATQGGGFRPSQDISRYVQLWRSGALNLEGLVSHRIGLDEINDGIELVRNGQAGRIMVQMR